MTFTGGLGGVPMWTLMTQVLRGGSGNFPLHNNLQSFKDIEVWRH